MPTCRNDNNSLSVHSNDGFRYECCMTSDTQKYDEQQLAHELLIMAQHLYQEIHGRDAHMCIDMTEETIYN